MSRTRIWKRDLLYVTYMVMQGKRDSIKESFYITDAMVNREWTQEEYDLRHVMTSFAIHGFTRPTSSAYVFCAVNSAIFIMLWSVRGGQFP